jgi:hypothetical protein
MLALLLVPILRGRRRSETIHVCSTLGRSLSLPGNHISRGHLAMSRIHLVGQLIDHCLQPQVDLHHGSELHVLSRAAIDCFLFEVITSLIGWTGVRRCEKLSSIIVS